MSWRYGTHRYLMCGMTVRETAGFESTLVVSISDPPLVMSRWDDHAIKFGKSWMALKRTTMVTRSFEKSAEGSEKRWTYKYVDHEWNTTKRRAENARERCQK
jgi:hypothetical protein